MLRLSGWLARLLGESAGCDVEGLDEYGLLAAVHHTSRKAVPGESAQPRRPAEADHDEIGVTLDCFAHDRIHGIGIVRDDGRGTRVEAFCYSLK
jgi:hypothetical protein